MSKGDVRSGLRHISIIGEGKKMSSIFCNDYLIKKRKQEWKDIIDNPGHFAKGI